MSEKSYELEIIQPTALESIERANVDMQISTAKKFPRSLAKVKGRMMELATLDQETAESCFYKLSRQGKSIEGPSIRLAEIAASSFGNIRYGARVIANDGKKITAQGFSHDLETNVYCAVEISRRITTKDGSTYSEDMQIVTGNAACAIALRNAMFKVVPFALVKPIYEAAKSTAVGDIKTLEERRTRMMGKLAAMGINEKRVLAAVEKNGIDEIGLSELETLFGLFNAVKDGDQNIDEAFPVPIPKASIGGSAAPSGDADKPAEGTDKKSRKPKPSAPTAKESGALTEVRRLLAKDGFEESEMVKLAIRENWAETTTKTLEEIEESKLQFFIKFWTESVVPELDKQRKSA